MEAFLAVEPLVAQRSRQTHFDAWSALAGIGTVIIGTGVFFLWPMLGDDAAERLLVPLALAIYGSGSILTIVLLATDAKRFTRRVVFPRLVRALAPLRPEERDLASVLAELKAARLATGRKIRSESLYQSLREAR